MGKTMPEIPRYNRIGKYPLSERGLNSICVFMPVAMIVFIITMILMCIFL